MRKTMTLILATMILATIPLFAGAFTESVQATPLEHPPLDYVALGDSITNGYGVREKDNYAALYAAHLEADTGRQINAINLGVKQVKDNNLGHNGWSSANLLHALRNNSSFRKAVRESEVVTWNIGTNDLRVARLQYKGHIRGQKCGGADNQRCLRVAVGRFRANSDAIAHEIRKLRSGQETMIRTMTIYYPYVSADKRRDSWKKDGGKNDFQVLKSYYGAVNRHIASTAGKYDIGYASVHTAYNGKSGAEDPRSRRYLKSDWVHPSKPGHKAIADVLRRVGYAPMCPSPGQPIVSATTCPALSSGTQ